MPIVDPTRLAALAEARKLVAAVTTGPIDLQQILSIAGLFEAYLLFGEEAIGWEEEDDDDDGGGGEIDLPTAQPRGSA